MNQHHFKSSWIRKFAIAFRGIGVGARGQNSFLIHVPVAVAVLSIAGWYQVNAAEFGVLTLCIGLVIASELFNSALEHLCRAVSPDNDARIRDVLDISSGAVLVACLSAAAVGCRILFPYLFAG